MEGALGASLTGLMVLIFFWTGVAFHSRIKYPPRATRAVLALWLTKQTVNIMTLGVWPSLLVSSLTRS